MCRARGSIGFLVLLAASAILLPPSASATPPTLPVRAVPTLEGEPAVGREVVLNVEFRVDLEDDLRVRLHGSDGIELLSSAEFTLPGGEGTESSRSWRMKVVREGFWSLALSTRSMDGEPGFAIHDACCGYGWSSAEEGAWELRPEGPFDVLPAPDPKPRMRVEVAGDAVHLSYSVERPPWLEDAALLPQVGSGTIRPLGHSEGRAVSVEDSVWENDIPTDGDGQFRAYVLSSYLLDFPRPIGLPESGHTFHEHAIGAELHCRNLRIEVEGAEARIAELRPCQPVPSGSSAAPSMASPLLGLLMLMAAAFVARRA